jgi:hypothetical protein
MSKLKVGLMTIVYFLLSRLKDKSTFVAIGAIISALGYSEYAAKVPWSDFEGLGILISGAIAILIPDKYFGLKDKAGKKDV